MPEKIVTYPIRLMFSISSSGDDGFAVLYEAEGGEAKGYVVWYTRAEFQKVRFIDAGDNELVFIGREEKKGIIFPVRETVWTLKEIRIRRDAMFARSASSVSAAR